MNVLKYQIDIKEVKRGRVDRETKISKRRRYRDALVLVGQGFPPRDSPGIP